MLNASTVKEVITVSVLKDSQAMEQTAMVYHTYNIEIQGIYTV